MAKRKSPWPEIARRELAKLDRLALVQADIRYALKALVGTTRFGMPPIQRIRSIRQAQLHLRAALKR